MGVTRQRPFFLKPNSQLNFWSFSSIVSRNPLELPQLFNLPKWHKEINNNFAFAGMTSKRTWFRRFKHLRDEKSFTDVTLACDGQTCKAHKMVLSACSPYFKALLEENPAKHPIIILKDVPFQHLTAILEFMYA